MDNHGRVFYIDHKNHTTTWQKPGAGGGGRSPGGTSPGGAGMATNKAFYFTLFNFLILNKNLVGSNGNSAHCTVVQSCMQFCVVAKIFKLGI